MLLIFLPPALIFKLANSRSGHPKSSGSSLKERLPHRESLNKSTEAGIG